MGRVYIVYTQKYIIGTFEPPYNHPYVTHPMLVREENLYLSCSCKFATLHDIIETSFNMGWISSSLRLPEIIHWTEQIKDLA